MTGPPCSGKSWLASALAERLDLPLLTKDAIKERLFETLGWGGAERSAAYNRASVALLLDSARLLIATGRPFILESNLRPDRDSAAYAALLCEHGTQAIQIHCSAPPEVLIERFQRRWEAGQRHPGHADDSAGASIADKIRAGIYGPLDLPGVLLSVDTAAGFAEQDTLLAEVQRHIEAIERAAPQRRSE
ncbi:MAG: ATP-binding protein [Anaerolineales bacterium]